MRASASTTFAPLEWRHWIRCRRGEVRSWQAQERRRSHVRRFSSQILPSQSLPRSSKLSAVGSGTPVLGAGRDNFRDSHLRQAEIEDDEIGRVAIELPKCLQTV